MSDWRPIETGPKDGTSVWLRAPWPHDGGGFQDWTGSFAVHSDGDPPEWRMHSKDIGWCRKNPPTHWRPLTPPIPSNKGETEDE